MALSRTYNYDGETASGANLETDLDAIIAAINSIDGGNLQNASVLADALETRADPVQRGSEFMNDFVASGGQTTTGAGTTREVSAIVAYIQGDRIAKSAENVAFTASKDNYLDLEKTGDGAGTYHVTAVANGADAPAIYSSDSIRLQKVVTDASDVTGVTDLRETQPVSVTKSFHNYRKGLKVTHKDDDEITVTEGEAVIPKSDGTDHRFVRLDSDTDYNYTDNNDGSALAVKTWYYVYACADAAGGVPEIVFSDNAPGTGPSGYDYYLYLGAIRTQDGATDFFGQEVYDESGRVDYHEYIEGLASMNPADTNWNDVDLITTPEAIPSTAKAAICVFRIMNANTSGYEYSVRKDGESTNGKRFYIKAGENEYEAFEAVVPVSSGVFEHKVENTALDNVRIDVVGYYE